MAAGDILSRIEGISPSEFVKSKLLSVQEYALLSARSIANLFKRPIYANDMIQQADIIGFGSLPIVLAACFFTGAALALNSATTLSRFGAQAVIGQLVSIGIIRELGPVLAGLVVAGRNASGMASELGSMVVTEQIDAMRALGTDPLKKLVTPRVVSTTVMLFFLTILGDLMGLIGGGFVAAIILGLAMPGRPWFSRTSSWDWLSRSCLVFWSQPSVVTMAFQPRAGHRAWAAPPQKPWLRR